MSESDQRGCSLIRLRFLGERLLQAILYLPARVLVYDFEVSRADSVTDFLAGEVMKVRAAHEATATL